MRRGEMDRAGPKRTHLSSSAGKITTKKKSSPELQKKKTHPTLIALTQKEGAKNLPLKMTEQNQ